MVSQICVMDIEPMNATLMHFLISRFKSFLYVETLHTLLKNLEIADIAVLHWTYHVADIAVLHQTSQVTDIAVLH